MASFGPAVGPDTTILPLLNGIRHLDALQARFGVASVLGGQCLISTTLDPEGRIVHLGVAHTLTFGELDGSASARIEAIGSECPSANLHFHLRRLLCA
jgi:2-dehydropantoate 2-reductase